MKLLLKKNIPDLGALGEIVEVKPGYARNYLIPQGFGIEAQKRRLIAQEEESKEKLRLLASELEGASCTIIARATEEGHLFGSVTPKVIAEHLASDGFQVETKSIALEAPIKELGIYPIDIVLHAEVSAQIKVWVVKGDESSSALEAMDAAEESGVAEPEAAPPSPEEPASDGA
jgi:large subunit ribosomal protein L9